MLRIFIGYDPRQPLAYNILQHSIVRHSSVPVAITPLILDQLPIKRRGLTEFTYSRFLVPALCEFHGRAIFMDADIAVTGDVAELFEAVDYRCSVAVMKQQAKFEWASVMVFNNANCTKLTPQFIENPINDPFQMTWAAYGIGEIPEEWNHCVHYVAPKEAKLYHYTAGIPCWPETSDTPEAAFWEEELAIALSTVEWTELMGTSVHAKMIKEREEHAHIG